MGVEYRLAPLAALVCFRACVILLPLRLFEAGRAGLVPLTARLAFRRRGSGGFGQRRAPNRDAEGGDRRDLGVCSHPRLAERVLGGRCIERPAHGLGFGDVEALALGAVDAAGVELGLGGLHALLERLHLGVELAEDIRELRDRMIVECAKG